MTSAEKRKRGDDTAQPVQKSTRVTRSQSKPAPGPPTVTVVTVYEGTRTQKLGTKQKIGFHMTATLETSDNEPQAATTVYEFRQFVRHGYHGRPATGDVTLGADDDFEEDGPFAPPYEDENHEQHSYVTIGAHHIVFDDHAGFSTTQQIDVGTWLLDYQVDFFWEVTRISDGAEWESDVITHTVTCPYAGGADAQIAVAVGADKAWTVTFD
jgi:hypothetical protein